MKMKSKLIIAGIAAVLSVACLAAGGCMYSCSGCTLYFNSDDPHEYLEFTMQDDGTYAVTGFSHKGYVRDMVIPAEHDGVAVTAVSSNAFYKGLSWEFNEDAIKSVVIEEGVKRIEDGAFHGCIIDSVTLPDSIEEIGFGAFLSVPAPMTLPAQIKTVGAGAFADSGLTGELDLTGVEYGTAAFEGTDITAVKIDADPAKNAFRSCKSLSALEIGGGVKNIPYYAFGGTAIAELTIPATVESVGEDAFSGSALKKLTLTGQTALEDGAFDYCYELDELILDDYTRSINSSAFFGCPLNDMEIKGESRYNLEDGCLYTVTDGRKHLVLGASSVNRLSDWDYVCGYAFAGRKMGDVTIDDSVKYLETNSFYRTETGALYVAAQSIDGAFRMAICSSIYVNTPILGYQSLYGIESTDGAIHIGEGCTRIKTGAITYPAKGTALHLPASLEVVENDALDCYYIDEVYYDYIGDTPLHFTTIMFDNMHGQWDERPTRGNFTVEWPEDFKFYVHEEVYDVCKAQWTDTYTLNEGDHFTIIPQPLADFLAIY